MEDRSTPMHLLVARDLPDVMPEVIFDDQFAIHRSVDGLSDTAFRLHVAAIFWSARNLMDGFVPEEDLDLVCARVRAPSRFAAECVSRGTWHEAPVACASEKCPPPPADRKGWVIHDIWELHPPAAVVVATQARKSDGGRYGNHLRWHEGRGVIEPGCEYCRELSVDRSDHRSEVRHGKRTSSDHRSVSDRTSDRSTESGAIPSDQSKSKSSSMADLVGRLNVSYAHELDDDDLLKVIIDSIHARTGRVVPAAHARKVATGILAAASRRPKNLGAYLRASIQKEPDPRSRFLPPEPEQPARHCARCHDSRRIEDTAGNDAGPCPDCHPSARKEAS